MRKKDTRVLESRAFSKVFEKGLIDPRARDRRENPGTGAGKEEEMESARSSVAHIETEIS